MVRVSVLTQLEVNRDMNILTGIFVLLIMALVGSITAAVGFLSSRRRADRLYQSVISQYLHAQTNIENHVRQHVLKDKDWDWAKGFSPIVTFGIKEDFTLMTDEEFQEAKEMAAKKMREGVGMQV